MDALVSVIVPVYGVERYLRQCLDSVVGQTHEGLEVVLVDDGSPDGCGAICDEYASRDARVRAFHTENGGLSAARNFGIGKARGEYVFLLDGDDWLESDAVCTLVDYACNTGADVVCCGRVVEWVTESEASRSVSEVVTLDGDEALRELLYGRRVSSQAWDKLYRADLFADVRFPVGHVFEDIATTHRLVMRAGRVACVPDALVHYREREGSISKQHSVANLVDYWRAHLQRYEELEGISEECRQACVRGCLNAISRTWCWWASCPAGERAESRGHVDAMRSFARDHTREVLRGEYSLGDKVRCLVGRHASPVVWVPMGALNRLRHVFTRRRGLYL